MAYLFAPFTCKGLELKNRIVMAPMCQYSVTAKDGKPNNWHYTLARAIKEALDVPVIAVGMLEDPKLAESVIGNEDADLVAIARGMLRDPVHAAQALGVQPEVPKQHVTAF
jgi:NADPH2 dehydrogenase